MTIHQVRRRLHWGIVLSVIIAYTSAYCRLWFTTQLESANWYLLVIHMNFGALVLILAIVSVCCRWIFVDNPNQVNVGNRTMAKTMHYALYCALFAIPFTAYIGVGFDFPLLGVYNLPGLMRFEPVHLWVQTYFEMLMITFTEPFGYFHRHTGTTLVLPALLAGHIGAAIFHRLKGVS
jgi:cytochrome b561